MFHPVTLKGSVVKTFAVKAKEKFRKPSRVKGRCSGIAASLLLLCSGVFAEEIRGEDFLTHDTSVNSAITKLVTETDTAAHVSQRDVNQNRFLAVWFELGSGFLTLLLIVFLVALFKCLKTRQISRNAYGNFNGLADRKRAEQVNQKDDVTYRAVVEDIPVLICRFLPGGQITYVNDAYCKYFDKTSEELVGKTFLSLIPEANRETVMTNISGLTVESPTQQYEHRVIAPDGKIRWQHWTDRAIFDNRGKPVTYQSIGEDITERKQAEEKPEEERDFAESLVDTAQTIILVLDLNGRIVRFNPYMEEISGYSLDEVRGKDWFTTFLPDEDSSKIHELFGKAIGDIQTRGNVNTLITKDGSKREIEWYDKTLRDADGNIIGLLSVGRDITEQKQAEEELRKSEEKYKDLVENQTLFIHSYLPDTTDLFANQAYAKFFGRDRSEIIGSRWINLIPEEEHDQILSNLVTLTPDNPISKYENYAISSEGKERWTSWINRAFFDVNGNKTHFQSVGEDITERKKAEEEIISQARFASENPNPVMRFSREGDILYANRPASRLLKKMGELQNRRLPEDWNALVREAIASGKLNTTTLF